MTAHTDTGDEKTEKLIDAAVELIGPDDPIDYRLKPTQFESHFKESAPEFSKLLSNAALVETAKRYETRSAQAKISQTVFKDLSKRATWAVFTATVAAALLAAYPSLDAESIAKGEPLPLVMLLGLVSLLAGAYASMSLYRIQGGGYLTRWMNARAGAETERLGYFNRLIQIVTDCHAQQPDIMLSSLELFRRYQLGMQQTYYTNRGGEHRQSMDKTLQLGSVATGLLALASGGAGILGYFQPQFLPLAAVGILGAALATVASRREEINQDERSFERYGRTADTLSHLREKHTEVQRAVASGDTKVMVVYVNAVHDQLSLEHRQWLAQADAIESAVAKLAQSLKESPPDTAADAETEKS